MKHLFMMTALVFGLAACSQPPKEDAKYQPVLNPHPKYFFTVSGKIDRELVGKINTSIEAIYSTRNKACDVVTNKLEGVRSWRTRTIIYQPSKLQKNGRYSFKIPIDKYLSGFCKWKLFRLNDYSGSPYSSTLADFSPCGGDSIGCVYKSVFKLEKSYLNKTTYNNYCDLSEGKVDCYESKGEAFSNTLAVPDNNNYSFQENYIYQRRS